MLRLVRSRPLVVLSTLTATGGAYYLLAPSHVGHDHVPSAGKIVRPPSWTPPSREAMLQSLKDSAKKNEEFDLLVIGGGATGAGVALDAASRGLKVGLVEKVDFSSGTSSKSTKLVHGGVRYLQKAIFELDYEQYKLVREALYERKIFLHTAPYLSNMLPIMLPVYKYWQVPYYYFGCKLYDILAGHQNISSSYVMSKSRALEAFPVLKDEGLAGAVVYYDGQHNDSRMNVALIMTAVKEGATIANHVEVTDLLKTSDTGKIYGAKVRDAFTGQEWNVHAKGVINATGPFTDGLLTLDNPSHKPIVQASSGVHITLPNYYSPRKMGLLDPATSDGRVIFFLPWQGNTIAGTTDSPAAVERDPKAAEEEVRWILDEIRRYLSPDIKVRRGDVLSAWSGLRPLVSNPNSTSTQALVRNHLIHTSPSGLLTIAGGKWTTYRAMSEETVDHAIKEFALQDRVKHMKCRTADLQLIGAEGWSSNMFIGLIQRFGLETEVARHLTDDYGDRAWAVCEHLEPTGELWPQHGNRLARMYPYIEAEVRYCVHNEYALTATDFLSRRARLSFLNARAAYAALPRVVEIMGDELHWSSARRRAELQRGERHLETMGLPPASVPTQRASSLGRWFGPSALGLSGNSWREWMFGSGPRAVLGQRTGFSRSQFEPGELDVLKAAFGRRAKDVKVDGGNLNDKERMVGKTDVREMVLTLSGGFENVNDTQLEGVLEKYSNLLGLGEFLDCCAELKDIALNPAPPPKINGKKERRMIPVEKSGGGV